MAEEQIKLPLAPVHNGLSPAILSATLGSDAKPIRLGLNVVCAASPGSTEHKFDFSEVPEGQPPPGFRSTVTGRGKPGDWKIILDEVPSGMAKLTPQGRSVSRRKILAQLSQNPLDEHFPLLIYEEETFTDFTLTARFKNERGVMEQMAGLAFRIQDETNYYVVRASSLGNNFRFYKVVNGQRGTLIGPEVPVPAGVWHEITVECKGNRIRCLLNGQELFPPLVDSSFRSGKIGFWTKSDSVSYFSDAKILYTPREVPAQVQVRAFVKKYPRLLGLQVYVAGAEPNTTRLIASKDEAKAGQPGGKVEKDVIAQGTTYYGKEKNSVSVVMPLRDRNGDIIAAVRVVLKSFPGQTEENAILRAAPIVKEMQASVLSLQDLME